MDKKDFITLDAVECLLNEHLGDTKEEIRKLKSHITELEEQVKQQERRIQFLEGKIAGQARIGSD